MDNYQAVYDAVRSKIHMPDLDRLFREAMDISHPMAMIQQEFQNAAYELQRPSVVFKPKIYPDDGMWCALLGDDLQSGVAGFGETPSKAMYAFDKAWNENNIPQPKQCDICGDHHDGEIPRSCQAVSRCKFRVGMKTDSLIDIINNLVEELDYDCSNWPNILAEDFKLKLKEFTERGLPSRVDTEASGLTLAPEEAKAETSKDVARSLPCEGITGDLDPALKSSEISDPSADWEKASEQPDICPKHGKYIGTNCTYCDYPPLTQQPVDCGHPHDCDYPDCYTRSFPNIEKCHPAVLEDIIRGALESLSIDDCGNPILCSKAIMKAIDVHTPKRESGDEYLVETIKLLKQEAETPTLANKNFRKYVHTMCESALRRGK